MSEKDHRAKAHTAEDAVEVIANVTPVRLRIQQLCAMECVRVIEKPHQSSLSIMMREVITNQVFSTPMGFLFHQLKNLQSAMESVVIEEEPKVQATDILRRSGVHSLDIMKDSNAVQQSPHEQVEAFLNQHQCQSVIAFTDGAVQESGRGSVAAIVL